MPATTQLARTRTLLLWLALAMCAGLIGELALTGHYEAPLQLLPIVLCALTIVAIGLVLLRPGPRAFGALRLLMIAMLAACALGVYVHVAGNLEFAREVNAAKAAAAPITAALTGGNPALAPGALGVTALVALIATLGADPRQTRDLSS